MQEIKVCDYWGLCPRCCREPFRRDVGLNHFMCCDFCYVYWDIGYNIMTTYERLVRDGDYDDEIGGPQNREAEIIRHDWETEQLLHTYERVNPPWESHVSDGITE